MKFSYKYAKELVDSTIFSASYFIVLFDDGSTRRIEVDDYSIQNVNYNDTPYLLATVISDEVDFSDSCLIVETKLYDDDNILICLSETPCRVDKGSSRIYFDLYIELDS